MSSVSIKFYIIVPITLNPERFDSLWILFVDGETVREVNHLVLCSMNDEGRRGYPWDFVDTRKCTKEPGLLGLQEGNSHPRHQGGV